MKNFIYMVFFYIFVKYIAPLRNFYQQKKLFHLAQKGKKIKICFIAMNLGMWRYQAIYELFKNDERFEVSVLLSPTCLWDKTEQARSVQELRDYFQSKDISYYDWDTNNQVSKVDIKQDINPDIIFYPQQYKNTLYKEHSYRRFLKKLFCLCPYGIATEETQWTYNTEFHNFAWKLFYTNQGELKAAQRIAYNKGKNVIITGYPNLDEYLSPVKNDIWKIKNPSIKRLIWAPHYSIFEDEDELHLSNFLWMAEDMIKIAELYQDKLQIAFKPHPKLRTRLYQHPDWGKEKTDLYYNRWNEMINTQLETGPFIDLFKSSDAMVHDSDSFQIEYLYVNKPVMFVKQKKEQKNTSELRNLAIECHYIGNCFKDIEKFINMIIDEDDPMKEKRDSFFKDYLLPPNGTNVALNIYNDIIKSISLNDK